MDFRGQEYESVLDIGGQKAGETTHIDEASDGSEERARDNIDRARSEMRAGKARSPQAGVIVGNVPRAGANAIETEGDKPQFGRMKEESTDETLDKAQKAYERAVAGFGKGSGDSEDLDKAADSRTL